MIDFDGLSQSAGAPGGQVGGNWHYQAELAAAPPPCSVAMTATDPLPGDPLSGRKGTASAAERDPAASAGASSEQLLGDWCLVPTSDLDLSDRMNMVVLQQIFNIACNGD